MLCHVMARKQRDWRNREREKWRKEGGQLRRRKNEKCGEKRERRVEVEETEKQM